MTAVEKVILLCKERKIPVSKLEKDLGFSNGYIRGLKTGKIAAERVKAIGDYLDVPYGEIDGDIFPKEEQGYYINEKTAEIAQRIFEKPELRILFDASEGVKSSDLLLAAEMLKRFKETNPDG